MKRLTLTSMILLCGCTTTMNAKLVTSEALPAEGQVYFLPRIDYMVSVDREIKACTVAYKNDAEAAIEWLREASNTIASATSVSEANKFYEIVKADPIFRAPEIYAYLEKILGSGWQKTEGPKDPPDTKKEDIGKNKDRLLKLLSDKVPEQHKPDLRITVGMHAHATPIVLQDTNRAFVISYQDMQSIMKGTDYSVETYPNGTLKGINVTLDDQTGNVITSALNGVTKLAAASSGFPLPTKTAQAAGQIKAPPSFGEWKVKVADDNALCNAATLHLLLERKALAAQVKENDENNLALTKKVNKLNVVLAKSIETRDAKKAVVDNLEDGNPKKPAAVAELKVAEEDVKKAKQAVAEAKDELDGTLEASDKAATKLDAIKKDLTLTKALTIKPESGGATSFDIGGLTEAAKAWLNDTRVQNFCRANNCTDDWPSDASRKLKVYATVYSAGKFPYAAPITGDDKKGGVYYRQPIKATLFVCKEEECLDKNGDPAIKPENVLLASVVDVPQLGVLAMLPLKNGPFQNNTLGASFAENGALTKLTYKTNAAAAKAAAVFETSADTILNYTDAKRKQQKAKLENTQAEVDAQTKLLESQLKLEKAQADLDKFRSDQKAAQ